MSAVEELFWARTWAYSLLPLLLVGVHLWAEPAARAPARRVELITMYVLGISVGAAGLGGAFGHLFLSDVVAQSVGWETGSPFQLEMGFANLALGVLGLVAANRRDGFRIATVLAVAVIGFGATAVHLVDLWSTGNHAAGNTIQNVGNLMDPLLLVLLLWLASRRRVDARPDAGFDTWQLAQRPLVAMAALGVGIGFGVGYAVEALWLGSTLGAALGIAAAWAAHRRPTGYRTSVEAAGSTSPVAADAEGM